MRLQRRPDDLPDRGKHLRGLSDEELRARFVERTPEGYVPMQDATKILGVSRQTLLQRVKRGELDAVHVYRGKRKGLRIKAINDHPDLFQHSS